MSGSRKQAGDHHEEGLTLPGKERLSCNGGSLRDAGGKGSVFIDPEEEQVTASRIGPIWLSSIPVRLPIVKER